MKRKNAKRARPLAEVSSSEFVGRRACPECKGIGQIMNKIFMDEKYDEPVDCPTCKKLEIAEDFRGGRTMLGCARKWKLTLSAIQAIIREYVR